MKNIGNMMRQAQEMQKRMGRMQDELATRSVEGSAGGGMVTCTVSGRQELLSLSIKPEVVNPEDIEMLQDLVVAAVGDAMRKSQELAASEMQKIAGGLGLNIPGLL